jgi:16S rRNA (guanine527-N7)-methyltransferase
VLRAGPEIEFRREKMPDVTKLVDRQDFHPLIPHLLRAGAVVDAALPAIRQFTTLLLQWNRMASNLISQSDETRVASRHLLESLEPAHWLKEAGRKRWIDFGSGGGFPALPLALAGVGESWTLVESRRTKTLFLRRAAQELQLAKVSVSTSRLEDFVLEDENRAAFDGFTSRATLTLGPTLMLAADLVVPGGEAYLWKGSRFEVEVAEDHSWQENWEHTGLLGVGDGHTRVARFKRRG